MLSGVPAASVPMGKLAEQMGGGSLRDGFWRSHVSASNVAGSVADSSLCVTGWQTLQCVFLGRQKILTPATKFRGYQIVLVRVPNCIKTGCQIEMAWSQ